MPSDDPRFAEVEKLHADGKFDEALAIISAPRSLRDPTEQRGGQGPPSSRFRWQAQSPPCSHTDREGDAGTDDSAQALHRRSRWTGEIGDAMKDRGETGDELLKVPADERDFTEHMPSKYKLNASREGLE